MKFAFQGLVVCAIVCTIGIDAVAMQPLPRRPALIGFLGVSGGSARLETVTVEVECRPESDDVAICDVTQRYVVHNASSGPQTLELSLAGNRVAGVELRADDELLAAEQGEEMASLETGVTGGRDFPPSTRSSYRATLEVAPRQRRTLVVTGQMRARLVTDSALFGAVRARHPILGTESIPATIAYVFHTAPLKSWGEVPDVEFEIHAPPHWGLRLSHTRRQLVSDGFKVSVEEVGTLEISARLPRPPVLHGGPYIGLGALLDDGGFIGRIGYEIGRGPFEVYSLAFDSDLAGRLVIAPTASAATPSMFCIFPSLSVGLGPAVLLGPSTAVGARLLGEVHFPFVGLATSVDWYPALDGPAATSFALMGRIGL